MPDEKAEPEEQEEIVDQVEETQAELEDHESEDIIWKLTMEQTIQDQKTLIESLGIKILEMETMIQTQNQNADENQEARSEQSASGNQQEQPPETPETVETVEVVETPEPKEEEKPKAQRRFRFL